MVELLESLPGRRAWTAATCAGWSTLAPDIVAAILDETLPPDVTLFELAVDPPALWEEQRARHKLPH